MWFHVAYVNLNTGASALLRLRPSRDPRHIARAAPAQALVFEADDVWDMHWQVFGALDLKVPWSVSFHKIVADDSVLLHRLEPWRLQVRQVGEAIDMWSGPPQPPPRRRPLREEDEDGVQVGGAAPVAAPVPNGRVPVANAEPGPAGGVAGRYPFGDPDAVDESDDIFGDSLEDFLIFSFRLK